eukprot:s7160_g3.t1
MMHRMLCIQSCGKPARAGAFAPNHVLMFVQNPAFGYCAPPCVDEEKGLSRVKVFRTPCWLLVRRTFKSASKLFYSKLCILEWGSGAGCSEALGFRCHCAELGGVMRQQASPCHAKCRKAVKTMGMIYASAVIVFLGADGMQAWLGPGPSLRPHGLQRKAADGGYPDIPEDVRGPDGIQSGMRSKLIEEARAMGDEDTPVSAGFGNPYLLVIVVVLVLGVASYFELGLDKVKTVNTTKSQDKELVNKVVKFQTEMYGM